MGSALLLVPIQGDGDVVADDLYVTEASGVLVGAKKVSATVAFDVPPSGLVEIAIAAEAPARRVGIDH